ncbi:MAG TPA: hypothetical protein VMU28_11195 [Terriglobales bacterium]|nr:hypothetical protein [Terriglobales bacterium]
MVAKCINPYCHRPFRYVGRGKLFAIEYPPTFESGSHFRIRENFWLCEECAQMMSVAIRHEHGRPAIRIINHPPKGRRKLDFVPEQQASVQEQMRIPVSFPEFAFEVQ